MNRPSHNAGILFSLVLVFVLSVPAIRFLVQPISREGLYGYTDDIPGKPENLVKGFFDRSTQRWADKYFDSKLGFRTELVRSFNEINFALFREAPRLRLITTKVHGLYSSMSIEYLNEEVAKRAALESKYREEAGKLLQVQRILANRGKYFEVVISSSKPYIYPDGLGSRYLVGGDDSIISKAASFGTMLKANGVQVTDSGPILRRLVETSGLRTHPYSGVHWNYQAACIIAAQVMDNARSSMLPSLSRLDCGEPRYEKPHMVDLDGYLLLNIWSDGGLLESSLYPDIKPVAGPRWRPKIVFIGDSFSGQLLYAFKQANIYSNLVMSNYFRVREVDDASNNSHSNEGIEIDEATIRAKIMSDIVSSDIIILQMADYNVSRYCYGFPDYFISKNAIGGGDITIASVTGAYDRESDGKNWWHWVEHKVNFMLQPQYFADGKERSKIHFEYATRGKQTLTMQIVDSRGLPVEIQINSKGDSLEVFDRTFDVPPTELAEVRIATDGKATPLGRDDPRSAAWMVRNFSLVPFMHK